MGSLKRIADLYASSTVDIESSDSKMTVTKAPDYSGLWKNGEDLYTIFVKKGKYKIRKSNGKLLPRDFSAILKSVMPAGMFISWEYGRYSQCVTINEMTDWDYDRGKGPFEVDW